MKASINIIPENVPFKHYSFRLPEYDKIYWLAKMQQFANIIAARVDCEVVSVHFGKQDSRGALSITLFDSRHCVPMQRHFANKHALLGYIEGYVQGDSDVKYLG